MPILSVFFGIIVRMWHDDHPPPHIHVEYQGFEALVDVRTGRFVRGALSVGLQPSSVVNCLRHQDNLLRNQGIPTFRANGRIQGADYDD